MKDKFVKQPGLEGDATLEEVDFVEKTLKEIKSENLSNSNFNLGIFYGLVFGIIGNLFVTILFDYKLKSLSDNYKFWILLGVIAVILFFLFIMYRESKKFKYNEVKIENNLSNLLILKDKIRKGEKVPKWKLMDDRNLVEKAWEDHLSKKESFGNKK